MFVHTNDWIHETVNGIRRAVERQAFPHVFFFLTVKEWVTKLVTVTITPRAERWQRSQVD